MRILAIVIGLVVATQAGCSRGPVVSITNRSTIAISNAVVSGPRFTNMIGTLQPGEERSLVVHPRGESHIRLIFVAGGQRVDSGGLGYLEESSHYRVSLTVTTNLQIEYADSIKHY